jgi:chemotaxis protein methyltransferase CheR
MGREGGGSRAGADTAAFLAWAVPRMGLRLRGLRNFRRTLHRRLVRRMAALQIPDLDAYRAWLEVHPDEWAVLATLCRITISRFWRDGAVCERIASTLLPEAARAAEAEGREVRVWSAGCASGEEPYTVALAWHLRVAPTHAGTRLDLLATDSDEVVLERARRGVYEAGSLRELPEELRAKGLVPTDGGFSVREDLRRGVRFLCQDLRREMPRGPFDLILCRNLAFTYFDEGTQQAIAEGLAERLREGGALVVGTDEGVPAVDGLTLLEPCVYVRGPSSRGP